MINKENVITKEGVAAHFITNMGDKYPSIKIKGVELSNINDLYLALGRNIRNDYHLWHTNNPLTSPFFVDNVANAKYHPDDASFDIIAIIWRKLNEAWPFYSIDSGAKVHENRFYGFGDSGSMAGEFSGYETVELAIEDMEKNGLRKNDYSTDPVDLGGFSVAILSGRQFVDQLYFIVDGNLDSFSSFGSWVGNNDAK